MKGIVKVRIVQRDLRIIQVSKIKIHKLKSSTIKCNQNKNNLH